MPQSKKRREDPRVGSFAEIITSPAFEHLSVQLSGEVVKISNDSVTIKKGKSETEMLINEERNIMVSKTTITDEGDKDTEPAAISSVKKGPMVKANATMLPSGDWELIGLNVREDKRKSE